MARSRDQFWLTAGIVLLVALAFVGGAALAPNFGVGGGLDHPPSRTELPEVPSAGTKDVGARTPIVTTPLARPPAPKAPLQAEVLHRSLPINPSLKILVVDSAKVLVAGARVEVREGFQTPPDGSGRQVVGPIVLEGITDEQGRFQAGLVLRSVEHFVVRAVHSDAGVGFSGLIDPRHSETLDTIVHLDAGGTLRGRIMQAYGAPLAGARVTIHDVRTIVSEMGGLLEREVVSGADGTFEASHVPSGTKRLVVRADGYQSVVRSGIDVGRGQILSDLEFVLSRGTSIAGKVIDMEGGQAIPNMPIFVRPVHLAPRNDGSSGRNALLPSRNSGTTHGLSTVSEAGSGDTVISGPDGSFRVDGLAENQSYLISALTGIVAAQFAQTAKAGDDNVVIRLRSVGVVSGTVIDDGSGTPVPAFTVLLSRSALALSHGGGKRLRIAAPDGRFSVPSPDPGQHFVVVEALGFARQTFGPVTIGPGERVQGLQIRLAKGSLVLGRVLDSAGAPIENAMVSLVKSQPEAAGDALNRALRTAIISASRESVRTYSDGSYLFADVGEGTYRLEARSADHAPGSISMVSVGLAARCEVADLQLEAAASVQGRVLDSHGTPDHLAIVQVVPVDAGLEPQQVGTDSEGRFVIRGLKPGPWRVFVIQSGGKFNLEALMVLRQGDVPVTHLKAGELKTIELRQN